MDHPSFLSPVYLHSSSDPTIEELVAVAITGVVNTAHAQGESLADLKRLVLEDDQDDLDWVTRQWLCDIVTEAWQDLSKPMLETAA
jgi:hypothetical protein